MQNKPIIPNVIDEFANLRTYARFSYDSGSLSHMTVTTWGLALLYSVPFPNILPNKACRNLIRKATFIFGSGDEQLLSYFSLTFSQSPLRFKPLV